MDPTKKPAQDAQGEADDSAQADDLDARIARALDAKLNSALTARDKRLQAAIGKTMEEQLAKLTPARAEDKPADRPADGAQGAAKADPEVIKLREQLDKLTRQADEDRKARTLVEEKSRRENARTAIREALAAKGITGAKARAVIADLEASGAVRFSEDGVPELVIKRARMKGSRAEDFAFDDIAAGVEDWSKSDDAKEFLPAQQPASAPARRGRPIPRHAKRPRSRFARRHRSSAPRRDATTAARSPHPSRPRVARVGRPREEGLADVGGAQAP